MSTPLFTPTPSEIANAEMTRFMQWLAQNKKVRVHDYTALYQWSIEEPALFWESVLHFCKIELHQGYTKVLQDPQKMPGAEWFPHATFNFAENLLQGPDFKTALVFYDENHRRRALSYGELKAYVAQTAHAFKALGVKPQDRVAGFLPNIPETVIAMLATASLGAIWSSCSPDFGATGALDRFLQIEPKILLTTDGYFYNGKTYDLSDKVREIATQLPSLQCTVIIPFIESTPTLDNIPHAILFDDLISKYDTSLVYEAFPFNHPLYILYSSGTTGKPKCIVHGSGGTLLQHLKELVLHTNLTQNDTLFYFTTCGWMMWHWMISSLAVRSTVLLYDGAPLYPTQDALFSLIQKEKVTVFGTSAKYLASLEQAGSIPRDTYDLTHLHTILSTGSPLNPHSFDYVYQKIKPHVRLCSISGGTDIVSCFALGNPILPIYRGELQSPGLGMAVEIFDEEGHSLTQRKGELVCTKPFPSMPIGFWNDPDGVKYHAAYFSKFPHVWAHGDYAEVTAHEGLILYGRSDAVLNPGGVRIGTAEIYRELEKIEAIIDSVAVGQTVDHDERIILFVQLRPGLLLDTSLIEQIQTTIRKNATPRHVPAKILQVPGVPRTRNGKIAELAVKQTIHGIPIQNKESLANPEVLEAYVARIEIKT